MLNLLIISSNPKAETLRTLLQPQLKIKLDVHSDFDHGLKDVFEKRPAAVCIQDQIAGVSGESVARHIQMLLGSEAPIFILMHDGNQQIKQIKGLFEHFVDLSLADQELFEIFKLKLKEILGPQWDKLYIPPQPKAPALPSPPSEQDIADQFVDDFLSDLVAPAAPSPAPSAAPPAVNPKAPARDQQVTPTTDELDFLRVEAVKPPVEPPETAVKKPQESAAKPRTPSKKTGETPKKSATEMAVEAGPRASGAPLPESSPAAPLTVQAEKPPINAVPATAAPASVIKTNEPASSAPETVARTAPARTQSPAKPVTPASPAEYTITSASPELSSTSGEDSIPEDLLLAFEKNYRSRNKFYKKPVFSIGIAAIVLVCGGYYLYQTGTWKPLPKPAPPIISQIPSPPANKLPSFIPASGRDATYAEAKPGWERYVGKECEFRLYRVDGKIRALQALASKGQTLSDDFLRTLMVEFAGSPAFTSTGNDEKQGFVIQRGSVGQKADILIYRQKASSAIKAVVVSLNN